MKHQPLSELSIEELKKQSKTLKFASGFIGAAIVVMFISGTILSISKKKLEVSLLSGLAFLPLFMIFRGNLKKITAEIERRNA
jgi:cation transporter-like permease